MIPVIPICFAWDRAASNARTYSLADMDQPLIGFTSDGYHWTTGKVKAELMANLILIGTPNNPDLEHGATGNLECTARRLT